MQLKTLVLISIVVMMLGNVMIADGSSGIDHRDIFVGASARAVGMGSAFTAGPSTNNGFLWNPSSLGYLNGIELNLGSIPFSNTASGPDQTFSLAVSPYTLGLTDKNVGNLSVAAWFNGLNGNNNVSTQIALLGYGLALGDYVSAGANVRYYQRHIADETRFLWSTDVGMQFTYPFERFGESVTFGMNLAELSNGIRYSDGKLIEPFEESLPLVTRFGMTYRPDTATLLSTDFAIRGQNDRDWGERVRLHFGAERWVFNNHFGVRVGYTTLTSSDEFGNGQWTQGISFRNSSGQLDYAHVSGGELEQNLHWISATLRWGGSKKSPTPTEEPQNPGEVKDTEPKDTFETTPTPKIVMPKTLDVKTENESNTGDLQLTEQAISPNSDGLADSTTFNFNVKADEKWELTLSDAYTEQVWKQTGTGTPQQGVTWNGMGSDGKLVSDGDYVAQLHIVDEKGTLHPRNSSKITVDLIPTTVDISKKAPGTVGVLTWDTNPIANWKLEVFDANDVLIEENEGKGKPPETIVLSKVSQLPERTYKFALSVQDIAGNKNTKQTELTFGRATTISGNQNVAQKPKFTLMVGSFSERRNADLMAANLQNLHPDQKVKIYTVTLDGKTMHRVTVGEFVEREDATILKQQIHDSQGVEPILTTPQ